MNIFMGNLTKMDHIYVSQDEWYLCARLPASLAVKHIVNEDYRCPYCGSQRTFIENANHDVWKHRWVMYECGTECVIGRRSDDKLYIIAETDRTAFCLSVTREDII